MFLNILFVRLKILLVTCGVGYLTFMFFIIPLYMRIVCRIKNSSFHDGFIGFLTIIPKFLWMINIAYDVCFIYKLMALVEPTLFNQGFLRFLSQIGVMDFITWVIVCASTFIITEVIRYIEYKQYFEIKQENLYLHKCFSQNKEDFLLYGRIINANKLDSGNSLFLKRPPTLHGKDSIYNEDIEYIIKDIEETDELFALTIFPKNQVKYCFTDTTYKTI